MSKSKILKRRRVTYPVFETDPKFHTQQQFINDCDINAIVKNAQRGIPPKFQPRGAPHYGDFSNVPSIEAAYEMVLRAEEAFLQLPSALRDELGNDPTRLPQITADQAKRYDLLRKLPTPGSNPPSQPGAPGGAPSSATPDSGNQPAG